ncbi:MAG: twin-arginine translocase subunit TatC [Myxococcota bacterium]
MTDAASQVPEDDVEMGFFEHLAELRVRLMRALYGVVPCVAAAWFFKEYLLQAMLDPLVAAYAALGIEPEIHFKNLVDPFLAYLKISIIAGLLAASPWVFWQLWGFIAPGLYKREKLLAIPFVLVSTICFAGGSLFGYFIVFPMGFETFLSYAGDLPSGDITMQPTIMIDEYIKFSTRLLLAFGVVFEVPVVVTFISAVGLVTWRGLLKFARWWILVATLLAAFLTPPDVASQLIMLVPLIVLYFISIGIAFLIDARRAKKAKEDPDHGKFER